MNGTGGIEDELLPIVRLPDIGITAHGMLSHGSTRGHSSKEQAGERDFHAISTRLQGASLEPNLALGKPVRVVADRIGASVTRHG
jgi:aryl-alcohol dehydrogenase-like predicted oxidoreductase